MRQVKLKHFKNMCKKSKNLTNVLRSTGKAYDNQTKRIRDLINKCCTFIGKQGKVIHNILK